jgi:hypothetical protein
LYTYDQTILAFPTVSGPEAQNGRNSRSKGHKSESKSAYGSKKYLNRDIEQAMNSRHQSVSAAKTIVNQAKTITKNANSLMTDPNAKRLFKNGGDELNYALGDKRFKSLAPEEMIDTDDAYGMRHNNNMSDNSDPAEVFTGIDPKSIKKRRQYGINKPSKTHMFLEKQLDTVIGVPPVETLLDQDLD